MKEKLLYELAGMSNLEGSLMGYLSQEIYIYIPPEGLVLLKDTEDEHAAILVFPVPEDWAKKNRIGDIAELENIGWEKKLKTIKLLDDFASLADARPKRFLAFAKKWGPLWHQSLPFKLDELNSEYEPWVEHLFYWRILAKEVKIILKIASMLKQNELADYSLWEDLTLGLEKVHYESIEQQRKLLAGYINIKGEKIVFPNLKDHSPTDYFIRLRIDWTNKDPELQIYTRMGFLSAAWLQLLQAVTASNVCVCSGCSRVYVRDRKPAENRNNFCESCRGETDKASKRLYAQKKRKSK